MLVTVVGDGRCHCQLPDFGDRFLTLKVTNTVIFEMISKKDLTDLCFDINECSDEPCKDLEYCMNMIGSYECQCLEGYKYNEVEQCEDIDECEEDLLACGSNNICKNNPGQNFILNTSPSDQKLNFSVVFFLEIESLHRII